MASIIVFTLLNLLPGDVAGVILGSSATPEAVASLRASMGLDQPMVLRYLQWLVGLLHGDLGHSAFSSLPIRPLVASKLTVTFSLVILGMVLAVIIAVPLGAFSAMQRRKPTGVIVWVLSQIGMSVPAFLAGIGLVTIFAVKLRWLPANGYTPLLTNPLEWLRGLILPAVALAVVQAAVLVRYVRGAFIDVLQQDYFRTARSVGWIRRKAIVRHGIRNAALQVVTVIGLQLTTLFVGAVVIENVFVLPGLGSFLLSAVKSRDLPVVQSVVMVLVTLILAINTLVDMTYAVIDPRLRQDKPTADDDEPEVTT